MCNHVRQMDEFCSWALRCVQPRPKNCILTWLSLPFLFLFLFLIVLPIPDFSSLHFLDRHSFTLPYLLALHFHICPCPTLSYLSLPYTFISILLHSDRLRQVIQEVYVRRIIAHICLSRLALLTVTVEGKGANLPQRDRKRQRSESPLKGS